MVVGDVVSFDSKEGLLELLWKLASRNCKLLPLAQQRQDKLVLSAL